MVQEADPGFERANYNGAPAVTENQKIKAIADSVRTEIGESINLTYDIDGYLIREDYQDGTYATYTLNEFKLPTRYRNRRGYVTLYEYDSKGNLLKRKEGLLEVAGGGEVQVTGEYGVYEFEYDIQGRLLTAYDPLGDPASTMHRTDFTYYPNGQLHKIVQGSDVESGARPQVSYTYNGWGLVDTVTDRVGNLTTYDFDNLGRLIKTTYDDLTTETKTYGTVGSGEEALVVLTKDRMNIATSYVYDDLKRLTDKVVNTGSIDGNGAFTPETDVTKQQTSKIAYWSVTHVPLSTWTDGKRTNFDLDYRLRPIRAKVYPQTGKELISHVFYYNNRVFRTVDPYGRNTYKGYSISSPNREIRTVVATHPDYTINNSANVLNVVRTDDGNDQFLVTDFVLDPEGNLVTVVDQKSISGSMEYDSRDRLTRKTDAVGTPVERKREYEYDIANNLIKMKSPRFFDSNDPEFENVFIELSYNGRNLPSKATAGTVQKLLGELTYTADEKVATRVDMGGNAWAKDYDGCCGHFEGSIDPLGHGRMTNRNSVGLSTHMITVSDYSTHGDHHDPVAAKTYNESTVAYDALRRPTAFTQWLNAQGSVNHQMPSNAGLWGNPTSNGLTTQLYFDNNIGDGVGLDSTTGMAIFELGGQTYSLSLNDVIAKLAEPTALGGALVSFTANESSGSAVVGINGEEEITVAIADRIGRTVITASLRPSGATNEFEIITHICRQYDELVSIPYTNLLTAFVLESRIIDAEGNISRVRADGGGRALQIVDADGNINTTTYDPYGNVTSGYDASNVGITSSHFDELGRVTSRTDTRNQTTSIVYDRASNPIETTDAKGEKTTIVYDNLNRRKTVTDRLGGVQVIAYNTAGQLDSVMDPEGKVTAYEYTTRGELKKITYADGGTLQTSYDPAWRTERKTDQAGDTKTFNYDMVDRLTSRDYRTAANSPSGTIADSDTYTYDNVKRVLTANSQRYTNTVTLAYDDGGRISSETLNIGGQNYTTSRSYDSRSLLSQQSYPNGATVDRTYTARGQLHEVKYNGSVIDTRTYDASGRLATSAYGNGTSTSLSYEAGSNLLAGMTTTNPGTNKVPNHAYTYDQNRNKSSETITGVALMADFGFNTGVNNDEGFDDEDRLIKWDRSDGNLDQTWNLSLVGDWDQFISGGTTYNNTHSNTHELTAFGANSISYDVKGNVTENSTGDDYTWDADNMMTSADTDGDGTANNTYKYDALGRRVGVNAVVYALSGAQVMCEYLSGYAPTSSRQVYVYGSYVDEPIYKTGLGGTVYYHRNQQYSVTSLTDTSGDVVEYYAYDAHGQLTIYAPNGSVRTTSVYKNFYFFTGRRYEFSTQLYYFRARTYDPSTGRFLSRDPLGYVDGMSQYKGYFAHQGMDPFGLCQDNDDKKNGGTLAVPEEVMGKYGSQAKVDALAESTYLLLQFAQANPEVFQQYEEQFGQAGIERLQLALAWGYYIQFEQGKYWLNHHYVEAIEGRQVLYIDATWQKHNAYWLDHALRTRMQNGTIKEARKCGGLKLGDVKRWHGESIESAFCMCETKLRNFKDHMVKHATEEAACQAAGVGIATFGRLIVKSIKRVLKRAPNSTARRTLFHYTDEAGQQGILSSKQLNASTKAANPKDVRYGNGQYVSDFAPGTKTPAQLSREFLGQPFQGKKFTHYVEIDVTDLNVIQGRNGVYVIPNDVPLDITDLIIGSGKVVK